MSTCSLLQTLGCVVQIDRRLLQLSSDAYLTAEERSCSCVFLWSHAHTPTEYRRRTPSRCQLSQPHHRSLHPLLREPRFHPGCAISPELRSALDKTCAGLWLSGCQWCPYSAMGILDLADELLRIILEHVASEPEKLISLERRAYLSQESFKPHPPPEPDQAQNIAYFRLTCKKFSDLGVIHQFSRVTTRFSRRGLRRLEKIACQPHIAERVKKFSYMVPFFYVEGHCSLSFMSPNH
jgi:hypothetical protein